jgi:hypothetical protein
MTEEGRSEGVEMCEGFSMVTAVDKRSEMKGERIAEENCQK